MESDCAGIVAWVQFNGQVMNTELGGELYWTVGT